MCSPFTFKKSMYLYTFKPAYLLSWSLKEWNSYLHNFKKIIKNIVDIAFYKLTKTRIFFLFQGT